MSAQTPVAGQDPSLHLQVESDQAASSQSDEGARRGNILLRAGFGSACLLLAGLAAWACLTHAPQASPPKPSGSVEAFAFSPALTAVRGLPSGVSAPGVRPASRSPGLRGTPRARMATQMALGWSHGERARARVVAQMTTKERIGGFPPPDAAIAARATQFVEEEQKRQKVSGEKVQEGDTFTNPWADPVFPAGMTHHDHPVGFTNGWDQKAGWIAVAREGETSANEGTSTWVPEWMKKPLTKITGLRNNPGVADVSLRMAELALNGGIPQAHDLAGFFKDLAMLETMGTSSGDLTFVIKMIPQLMKMATKLQEREQGPPKELLFPDAAEMDLHASSVISTWSQITNSYATSPNRIGESSREYDGALGRRLQALGLMALEIQMSLPDEVLALVRREDAQEICIVNPKATGCDCAKNLEGDFVATDTPDDVFAMATVTKKMWRLKGVEESWKLGWFANSQGFSYADTVQLYENGYVPVFEIGNVASRPSRSTGLGKEFLVQIMRQAATTGHLVLLSETSPRLTDYYQEMGFVQVHTTEGTVLVYDKPIEAAPVDTMFEIGRLHRLG